MRRYINFNHDIIPKTHSRKLWMAFVTCQSVRFSTCGFFAEPTIQYSIISFSDSFVQLLITFTSTPKLKNKR